MSVTRSAIARPARASLTASSDAAVCRADTVSAGAAGLPLPLASDPAGSTVLRITTA